MSVKEDLVKSVASKINYYIDVKQKEDGFNLSGNPWRCRKPLYIPVPPPKPRFNGFSSIKRNRFSIYNKLQEQPNILAKRQQRNQNLLAYFPIVSGNTKRDKIVQTASKFLVSLTSNKLPSIKERKNYLDFIYNDIGSLFKDEIYFDYGKKSPDSLSPITVDSNQPHSESLASPLIPKEEVKPTGFISYSAEPIPEPYGILTHSATQTNSDNYIPRYPLTNVDEEYTEIKCGKESTYIVVVRTGNVLGASTRAQVKIVLCGTEGKTGLLTLAKSETNKIKFQKGKEDHFILKTFNVGYIEKIRIGHNRPELPYAWFLHNVTVYDQIEKWVYMFPCDQWFSGEDGDKQTYREVLLEKNMAIVEDIQNLSEEALLLWLARTENQNQEKDKDLLEKISDKIKTDIHLNEHETLDTSRSDSSSLSSDSSSLVNRFHQGTVISVQNQVTTGTQTNKIPSKLYNLARDFHQTQNKNTSSEEQSLKVDNKPEKEDEESNYTFNGNKKCRKTSQNESQISSNKDDFLFQ